MPSVRRFKDEWILRLVAPLPDFPTASVDQWRAQGSEYLSQALMDAGFLSFEMIAALIRNAYRIESVKIAPGEINQAILSLVPEKVCRRHEVSPVSGDARSISLAMANPLDQAAVQDVQYVTGRMVVPLFCSPRQIRELTVEHNSPDSVIYELMRKFESVLRVEVVESGNASLDDLDAVNAVRPPVVQLVDGVISNAVRMGASDVHIEHDEASSIVRYRIDGLLKNVMVLPRYIARGPVVARLKIMSGLDVTVHFRPQDGRAKLRVGDEVVGLRVSTLPSQNGEKVVLRILSQKATRSGLDQLGFRPALLARLRALLARRQGVVLVTGPTGSGKTTTLYAALQELKSEQTNIVTIEDPIEYRLEGITQVQVNEKQGLVFASALRSVLRQDPDVILVGEIRDGETASVAIQAAMTGHLVFSTLHTNDAVGAVARLADIGVERFKIASALLGVTAQRLVRRLCPACSEPGPVDGLPTHVRDAMRRWSIEPRHRVASGCSQCGFSGYRTRFALMELLEISPGLRERISEEGSDDSMRAAAFANGALETLEVDAMWHVAEGHTSLEEVLPHIRFGEPAGTPAPVEAATETGIVEVLDATPNSTPEAAQRRRVIVASSDPIWGAIVPSALEAGGFEVVVTESGPDALAAIARSAPAAVVAGPEVQTLTPGALIGAIRKVLGLMDLPVVGIAASADDAAAAELIRAGANDVLTPPVDPRAITDRVEATISRRSTWSAEKDVARPPMPIDEPARLQALRSAGTLDTPPEERFDRITRAARRLLNVPMSVVSLVDADRQWFKSRQGVDAEETPREIAFCGHAINHDDVFVVPDARLDPRFSNNPLVSGGPMVRFYAGCPIVSPDGHNVGMMCVMDTAPRNASEEQKSALKELAREVQDQMWPVPAA